MPENQRCFSLPRQKRALLALEWAVGFQPAGSVWVLLLAARGWPLVEIGLAEGLFHVVSLCCELPSGLLAGVTVGLGWRAALFVLGLGGALAGLLAVGLDRLAYARAALLAGAGTALCAGLARGSFLPVLMASGLAAGLLDDALQLVSDKRLNDRFPSAQRATLVSVSSMAFSLFMIPLSPLFGMLFS